VKARPAQSRSKEKAASTPPPRKTENIESGWRAWCAEFSRVCQRRAAPRSSRFCNRQSIVFFVAATSPSQATRQAAALHRGRCSYKEQLPTPMSEIKNRSPVCGKRFQNQTCLSHVSHHAFSGSTRCASFLKPMNRRRCSSSSPLSAMHMSSVTGSTPAVRSMSF